MNDRTDSKIRWPAEFAPTHAPVFVRNTLRTEAPPARVWRWLTHATRWPSYYPNASKVRLQGGGEVLGPDTRFTWKTFGVSLVSQVRELVPEERLAWDARGLGVWAYHAWLIVPEASGCTVITEETQHGFLARLGALVLPRRMGRWHQVWLEQLDARAKSGDPV